MSDVLVMVMALYSWTLGFLCELQCQYCMFHSILQDSNSFILFCLNFKSQDFPFQHIFLMHLSCTNSLIPLILYNIYRGSTMSLCAGFISLHSQRLIKLTYKVPNIHVTSWKLVF